MQNNSNIELHHMKNTFQHLVDEKGLTLHFAVDSEIPSSILTDRKRLDQVLKNLLSNAVKFTDKGAVSVTVGAVGLDVDLQRSGLQPDSAIAIAVQDSGVGIPPDKQKIIFEAFQQADGSTARKYGGTGLGLSISRDLAGLLGGEIQLASEEGKGATFTLFLPLSPKDQGLDAQPVDQDEARIFQPQEIVKIAVAHIDDDRDSLWKEGTFKRQPRKLPEDDAVFKGKRILIVDDDMRNVFALAKVLRDKGMEAVKAEDGIRALAELDREEDFDLVLMDIMMPGMDGYETMQQIRQQPHLKDLPIIALTAKAMKEDRNRCLAAGANDYLAKPVDIERLLALLRGWLMKNHQ